MKIIFDSSLDSFIDRIEYDKKKFKERYLIFSLYIRIAYLILMIPILITDRMYNIIILVCYILLLIIAPVLFRKLLMKLVLNKSIKEYNHSIDIQGCKQIIEITSDKLKISTDLICKECKLYFIKIKEIEEYNSYIYIYFFTTYSLNQFQLLQIPINAFKTDEEKIKFLNLINNIT